MHDRRTGLALHLGPDEARALVALRADAHANLAPDIREAIADMVEAFALDDGDEEFASVLAQQRGTRTALRDDARWEQLQEALQFAYDRVPFHRDRMDRAGVRPHEVDSTEALSQIPVMTKSDVRANFPKGLIAEGVDLKQEISGGNVVIGHTSGTTDERLSVVSDYRAGRLPESVRVLLGLADDAKLARGAVFTSPLCMGTECHLGDSPLEDRMHGATLTLNSSDDVMAISDFAVREIVEELRTFEPDVFFVNPWYASDSRAARKRASTQAAEARGDVVDVPNVDHAASPHARSSMEDPHQVVLLRHRNRRVHARHRMP